MTFKNFRVRLLTSLVLFLLIYFIFSYSFVLNYVLIIFGVLALLEFFSMIKKITSNKKLMFILNFTFVIYMFIFCFLFSLLYNHTNLRLIVFILLVGCIASDIGGYLVGKFFQGPKLTKISPNKTITGSFGSFIFTCIVISFLIFYFTSDFNLKILFIGFSTSLACQIGDLFFSYLKRRAKLKDTGNIFPGHGGVLDRIDGILLGMPVGFLSINLIY